MNKLQNESLVSPERFGKRNHSFQRLQTKNNKNSRSRIDVHNLNEDMKIVDTRTEGGKFLVLAGQRNFLIKLEGETGFNQLGWLLPSRAGRSPLSL